MIGRKINNYEIISLLGEGGMGSVYVAEHPVLGRRLAVKVLKREFAEDKNLVARFMNEARAASAIRQPNIIEILDVGTLPEGVPYLMMDLLEGESLASRLARDKRLPVEDAIAIATQAAAGLGAAHAKHIVHRDLKPDNIFLVRDAGSPGGQRVVILDFGIAKLRGDLSTGSVKTHTGSVMGTPPYMSPEQCRGASDDIDQRTDVYAMGIILHEMLSGTPPFVGAGFGELLMMHMTQPPAPLRSLDVRIPPHVEAAVLRALEKNREARFSSMGELTSALLAASAQPAAAVPVARTLLLDEAPSDDPRRSPAESPATGRRMISTLTSSAGEMFAAPPQDASEIDAQVAHPTLPVRRSRRIWTVGVVLFAASAVAAAIVLGARQGPLRRAATAAAPARPAPPVEQIAAPAPAPAPSPPAAIIPPPSAPAPSALAAPAVVAPAPEAPRDALEPDHRDLPSSSKHATNPRPARGKTRAAPPRPAVAAPAVTTPPAGAAPSAAPAPRSPATAATAPAPVAPVAKPGTKINTEKW